MTEIEYNAMVELLEKERKREKSQEEIIRSFQNIGIMDKDGNLTELGEMLHPYLSK